MGKLPKNPKIIEFTKHEPFNRNFWEKRNATEVFEHLNIPCDIVLLS